MTGGRAIPPAPYTACGKAVGQDMRMGEILALAMRHSVGRPATRIGGGTIKNLWSGKPGRRLSLPLLYP